MMPVPSGAPIRRRRFTPTGLATLAVLVALVVAPIPPAVAARTSPSGPAGQAPARAEGAVTPVFVNDSVGFGPSAVVSATLLGFEPGTTIERRVAYSDPGAVDPRRVLVNAPLSSRTEISIENRSLDGGKTFRLLYDRTCAERSRPTCLTGGGGDAEEDVNLKNGNLFFADQEVLVQEALASSTDHGDTFPADRQFPITNTATVLDRQWLAATDSSFKAGPPLLKKTVEAFLAYHLAGVGQYVQAIDPTGMPMEQLLPQIPEVAQSGQLRVDNSQGPGHQWIYQPYAALIGGTRVATAFGPDYGLPTSWQSTAVTADLVTSFPWIALDDRGNAYLTWDTGGAVYYSASPIDDARNDPSAGGRPGSYWTPRVQLSPPQIGSAVFPEAIGGAPGRFGVTYVGTTEFIGEPDDAPQDTHWNTYAAVVTNALGVGGPPVVHTGQVSHRFVHHGNICTSGTACAATMKDRSFADLIDVGRFQNGQLGVVYQDNFSTFADTSETTGDGEDEAPFIVFARQVSGPDLSGPAAGPEANHVFATVDDAGGDATWPNEQGAQDLPSLDIRKVSLGSQDATYVVGRIELGDASIAQRLNDLEAYNTPFQSTPPATRVVYVFRFSTATEIFHLSLETTNDGQTRCYGGRLDSNDQILNPASLSTIGAAYNTDSDVHALCYVQGSSLVLKAPVADLPGLILARNLYSVTAFTMAGPAEALQALIDPMRTVDASPAFDASRPSDLEGSRTDLLSVR